MAKRKATVRIAIGLAALAAVLAVFAWQQGDEEGGGEPLNAIALAAERTQEEPGGRAEIRAIGSSSSGESITMTGWSVFDGESGRSQTLMEFPNPGTGEMEELEIVTAGSTFYTRSSRLEPLPDGSTWMSLDTGTDLGTPLPTTGDARSELELLEKATGGVEEVGTEEVRGVETTRYTGTVENNGDGESVEVEVWIDGDGLVRRMRLLQEGQVEGGEESITMDMQMEFVDFGDPPEIELPDQSEVFDATALAEAGRNS